MEALEALKRYDENYEAALLQHGENIVSEPVYENQKAIDQLESLIGCQFSKKELGYIRLKTLGYDSTPVSYTHLDVYKRQISTACRGHETRGHRPSQQ